MAEAREPGWRPRVLALEALLSAERGESYAGDFIAAHGGGLETRDRALALEIALGCLRWKLFLDHGATPFLRRPPSAKLAWILRIALFQMWKLDRVPIHAAVDTAVEIAKRRVGIAEARMVNAVLRRCAEAGPRDPEGDSAKSLSIRHSHPEWLVERWLRDQGTARCIERLQADNLPPPLWVRIDPRSDDALPWTADQVVDTALGGEFARLAASREELLASGAFARGRFSLQDPSAGFVASLLSPFLRPGHILADLCSAPGGKLAYLGERGRLDGVRTLSLDLSPRRQRTTLQGWGRLRLPGIATLAADGRHPPLRPASVDAALLDAPCSNLGVLSRRPEARWRHAPRDLAALSSLQTELASTAAALLAPGGRLVYATCSVEAEETDVVLAALRERHPELRPVAIAAPDPSWQEKDSVRIVPGRHGWDGFFAAVFEKTSAG